jgi:hypothetical protein
LLGIYLNDHLAAATAGLELFRRTAGALRGTPTGKTIEELVEQVAQDRAELLDLMGRLAVPVRHYKLYAGWAAEKAGRLKLNGQLRGRSPLSSLVELEGMRLGVEGKASGWRTLRLLADTDARLDAVRLDQLLDRARKQSETLEELRAMTVAEVFGT